jgi:hypothetical protein
MDILLPEEEEITQLGYLGSVKDARQAFQEAQR